MTKHEIYRNSNQTIIKPIKIKEPLSAQALEESYLNNSIAGLPNFLKCFNSQTPINEIIFTYLAPNSQKRKIIKRN